MSTNSKIEWTEATWNPVTGCTKLSSGCKNCYAELMTKRLKAMGQSKYANGFQVTIHENELQRPLSWKKPHMVFVNSMSDLFHAEVPDEFIVNVVETMMDASIHTFQILTKRSERLIAMDRVIDWPDNVWAGVTVEESRYIERIEHLRGIKAKIKFLSFEPLLGPFPDLDLAGIDWVIVGGESGPKARPIEEDWVLSIRDCCIAANVPFFFKQWGGRNKKKSGRLLQGRTWDEMPNV